MALSRFEEMSFEDVGTRRDHLMDLQELWVDALSIVIDQLKIQRQNGMTKTSDQERKYELEIALRLLEAYLTKDYTDLDYRKQIDDYHKENGPIMPM